MYFYEPLVSAATCSVSVPPEELWTVRFFWEAASRAVSGFSAMPGSTVYTTVASVMEAFAEFTLFYVDTNPEVDSHRLRNTIVFFPGDDFRHMFRIFRVCFVRQWLHEHASVYGDWEAFHTFST